MALLEAIRDWNDTLTYFEFEGDGTSEAQDTKCRMETILNENKAGNRVALKKEERRRRNMITS
jgi:hypothetical protein